MRTIDRGDAAAERRPRRRRPRAAAARATTSSCACTRSSAGWTGCAGWRRSTARTSSSTACSTTAATRELLDALDEEDRERLGFDVAGIDWDAVPQRDPPAGAARARPCRRRRSPRPTRDAGAGADEGPPALAFFDVEGVVLDTTVAHFYAWLRTRDMPELDRAAVVGRPGHARARLAAGRPALARRVQPRASTASTATCRRASCAARPPTALPDFIQPRVQHAAVRRIRAHRRRGDRVVLITGALDFLVDSLRAPRRRAGRRAAGGAHRPLHRRAGRAAADRRRPRLAGRAAWPPSTGVDWPTATPTATAWPTCRCWRSSATRTRSTRTSACRARRAGAGWPVEEWHDGRAAV